MSTLVSGASGQATKTPEQKSEVGVGGAVVPPVVPSDKHPVLDPVQEEAEAVRNIWLQYSTIYDAVLPGELISLHDAYLRLSENIPKGKSPLGYSLSKEKFTTIVNVWTAVIRRAAISYTEKRRKELQHRVAEALHVFLSSSLLPITNLQEADSDAVREIVSETGYDATEVKETLLGLSQIFRSHEHPRAFNPVGWVIPYPLNDERPQQGVQWLLLCWDDFLSPTAKENGPA